MKNSFPLFYFIFSDSETTEDEGGEQSETKEDSGDVEDQAVHTGIQHFLLFLFLFCFFWPLTASGMS